MNELYFFYDNICTVTGSIFVAFRRAVFVTLLEERRLVYRTAAGNQVFVELCLITLVQPCFIQSLTTIRKIY